MKKLRALVAMTLLCMMALSGCGLVDTIIDILDQNAQDKHEQTNPAPVNPAPENPTPSNPTPADPNPNQGGSTGSGSGTGTTEPAPVEPTPLDPSLQPFVQDGTVNPLTGLAGIREETLDRMPVALMVVQATASSPVVLIHSHPAFHFLTLGNGLRSLVFCCLPLHVPSYGFVPICVSSLHCSGFLKCSENHY